jgi:uncharacterized protein (TIGR00255 family)
MMKSMTGYGEASRLCRGVKITVQIRSLNHRHLDLQLRVPREYLAFEEEMRKNLRGKVGRGRIEVFVNRSSTSGQMKQLEFDDELTGQYLAAIRRVKKKFGLGGEVEISLVARLPELFRIRDAEIDARREREALSSALLSAMQKLERSRVREGRRLKSDMEAQLRYLKKISLDLEGQAAQYAVRVQKNAGVSKEGENGPRLANESYEPGNWVIKGDVNEEVVRLKSHIAALAAVVRERQPVGKKIDFVLQEVQRELNTISSKLPHLPVVQLVLQGKERVEKMREQTQNVE